VILLIATRACIGLNKSFKMSFGWGMQGMAVGVVVDAKNNKILARCAGFSPAGGAS
jgi:hypothetical protein